MKRLLLTAALTALALPAPAHASHSGHTGGCSGTTTFVPSNVASGQDSYNGTVTLTATATVSNAFAPTATITVDCVLFIDGVMMDFVLSASGIGAVAGSGPLRYAKPGGALVELCAHAVVDGHPVTPVTCNVVP